MNRHQVLDGILRPSVTHMARVQSGHRTALHFLHMGGTTGSFRRATLPVIDRGPRLYQQMRHRPSIHPAVAIGDEEATCVQKEPASPDAAVHTTAMLANRRRKQSRTWDQEPEPHGGGTAVEQKLGGIAYEIDVPITGHIDWRRCEPKPRNFRLLNTFEANAITTMRDGRRWICRGVVHLGPAEGQHPGRIRANHAVGAASDRSQRGWNTCLHIDATIGTRATTVAQTREPKYSCDDRHYSDRNDDGPHEGSRWQELRPLRQEPHR